MITFCIEQLPPTVNRQSGMHWRKKAQIVKQWHGMVAIYCGGFLKPKAPFKKAKLTLTRFSSVEPDFDGLVSSFKPVIDGLIKCGVLENDKMSNIGKPDYRWEKVKPKQGKIVVTIEGIQ